MPKPQTNLQQFQTFRRKASSPSQSAKLNTLFERISVLQRQIVLAEQRQQKLMNANDQLTSIIINYNHTKEQHEAHFIEKIEKGVTKKHRNQGKKKHLRVHTQESNDQNNFRTINCGSTILSRNQYRSKPRKTIK